MNCLMMWDEWPVGEGGLGRAAASDVLAILNQRAVYASLPPPTVSAVILSGGANDSFQENLSVVTSAATKEVVFLTDCWRRMA